MKITEISVKPTQNPHEGVLAYCKLVFDNELAVKDIKIMDVRGRVFIAMPAKKITQHCTECGHKNALIDHFCASCGIAREVAQDVERCFQDLTHPINPSFRAYVEETIMEEYDRVVGNC